MSKIIFAHLKYTPAGDLNGEDIVKIDPKRGICSLIEKRKGKWNKVSQSLAHQWISKNLEDLTKRGVKVIFKCDDFDTMMTKRFDCFLEAKYNEN